MCNQWRAEKRRGALLVDHELTWSRRQLCLDVVDVLAELFEIAVGRLHAASVDMTGAVDHRHARPPRRREQPLRGWHGLPGMLAAGAGEFLVHLFDRPAAAQIG